MSDDLPIQGLCPPRFERVREAFTDHFAQGLEGGARFCFAIEGEIVVDLWGGHADRARTRPFDQRTLTPVFSTTKAVTALVLARAVDQGLIDYDQPAAELWPEFAQGGKGQLSVAQVLSHQSGLSGFAEPIDPNLWFDWQGLCAALAAMTPLWPPGAASGYHPITFGYLAGELFRRADGRTVGQALAEDLTGPLGLDMFLGLPAGEDARVAEMHRPSALPNLGEMTPPRRAAFGVRWGSPPAQDMRRWRAMEIPSANLHATAESLARLMAILACDGRLDGRAFLTPSTIAEAGRERIAGDDLVLPYRMSWGAGFMRNATLGIYGPGEASFGHSGWGGSCAFADPARRISAAYVMTRQSADLLGDPRSQRLIAAAYNSL